MKCCLAQQDGYECNCQAIQRVRNLHKPIATQYSNEKKYTGCAVCGDEGWNEQFYPHEYPCETIKALEGE